MPSAPPPRWFMRLQWRLHKFVWNASGGRLGARQAGMPVLELTTTGHRSGRPRSILIWYVSTAGGPVIAGTNAGADHDPAWVRNLRADPAATVRAGGRTEAVVARFLDGEEHAAVWEAFVEAHEAYRGHAEMLTRPIPLVELSPGPTA